MKILLTRHGQTVENKQGVILGHHEGTLTKEGIESTKKLKKDLDNYPIDVVYSSDLGRCIKTTDILVKGRELEVKRDSRLREINFGIYQGKPYETLQGDYLSDLHKKFPEGESNNQLIARVIDALNDIFNTNYDKTVLIVTHSGPISVIQAAVQKNKFIDSINKKIDHNEILELVINDTLNYPG